jgi:large subunit ribosomal protein L6
VEKFYVILDKKQIKNMSRIGKKIIDIPLNVIVSIEDRKFIAKGQYGTLEKSFLDYVEIQKTENKITVIRNNDSKQSRAYHGLTRALIQNMISGVHVKFLKVLIAEGIGYKFQVEKQKLILNMGYTHPVEFIIPDDLHVKLESATKIIVSGIDKEKVGFLAAKIREIRPPEPYKGKGIMYEGEKILRKAGKSGK